MSGKRSAKTISIDSSLRETVEKLVEKINYQFSYAVEDGLRWWLTKHTSTDMGNHSLNPDLPADKFARLTAPEREVLETVLDILRSKDPNALNSAKLIKGRVKEFNLLLREDDASKTADKKQGSKPAKTGTDS